MSAVRVPIPRRALAGLAAATVGAACLAPRFPLVLIGAAAGFVAVTAALSAPPLWAVYFLTGSSFLSGFALPFGPLHVRPEQVAAPIVAAIVIFGRRSGRLPWQGLLVALWICAGLCGAFGEREGGRALVHTLRLCATVLPLFLIPFLARRPEQARKAWNGFLVLATLESVVALGAWGAHLFFGTMWGVTAEIGLGYVHPQGTLLEPNLLGTLSAAAAIALIFRALSREETSTRRLVAAFAALVSLSAVAVSLTRAAWIALPLGLVFVFVARSLTTPAKPSHLRARAWRLGGIAMAAFALALFFFTITSRGSIQTRSGFLGKIGSLGRLIDDPNVRVRLRSYEQALRLWRASPLFGSGHGAMERLAGGEDKELAWAGNLEVHLLVDSGIAGLAFFMAFVGATLLPLCSIAFGRRERSDALRAAEQLGALFVILLCAQATDSSWLASMWVVFGLAIAGRSEVAGTNRLIRLLYVHPSDELYGSDRVLLELVSRLDRSRFAPQVLLSTDVPYAGRLSRRLLELGIPVSTLRIGVLRRKALGDPLHALRYAFDVVLSTVRISWFLVHERIDLVHANTVTVFPAAFAARLAGKKLVWHLHEIVTDRPGRALLHALVRNLAHRIVVVSEAARKSLGRAGLHAEIISNGIEAREAAPVPAEPPRIAYIGRLSARKGPHVLLRAAARVLPAHPPVRFILAGDEFGGAEGLTRELKDEAERLGISSSVEFRPFAEDVTPLLEEASIVVSPSILPESFGLILLEAMATGRPVVASAHGGPAELIVEGETGFLVPPGDDVALAAALDRLLSDKVLRERLGSAGRERARLRFRVTESVRRFETIYGEVATS